jgi:hypothetical protein
MKEQGMKEQGIKEQGRNKDEGTSRMEQGLRNKG